MIVLDASVGLKRVLAEEDSDKALALQGDFIAPEVYPVECSHGLLRAERKGLITKEEAEIFFGIIMTDLPHLYPSVPPSFQSL